MTGAPTPRPEPEPPGEVPEAAAGDAAGATGEPERRGRRVASLYREVASRLFAELAAAERTPGEAASDPARARGEWECFALYACVRGLVAAGGFNRETAIAIDAFHQAVLDGWRPADHGGETLDRRRRLIAARYAEYGAIGQAADHAGGGDAATRLAAAAARHLAGEGDPPAALSETLGDLHQELVAGAAAAAKAGSGPSG